MEGAGDVQVNYQRNGYFEYYFILKLKNTPANVSMLHLITEHIGSGCVSTNKHFAV